MIADIPLCTFVWAPERLLKYDIAYMEAACSPPFQITDDNISMNLPLQPDNVVSARNYTAYVMDPATSTKYQATESYDFGGQCRGHSKKYPAGAEQQADLGNLGDLRSSRRATG